VIGRDMAAYVLNTKLNCTDIKAGLK